MNALKENNIYASQKAVHFEGLNAFRFFAASLVVLVHAQEARKHLGNFNFSLGVTDAMGGLSVTFFFVLSGFLITYLLLKEKTDYRTVEIKNFYWRRILRIWPLYYLIILIAFSVLNNPSILPEVADKTVYEKSPTNLLLYLVLLPNIAWIIGKQIIYANQLWSVGVEEQFYLFWPVVVKKLSPSSILKFMIGLIVAFILIRNAAAFLERRQVAIIPLGALSFINSYLTVTRISCMSIGGIGAYFYFYNPNLVAMLVSSSIVDVLIATLVLFLGATNVYIPYVMYEAYSLLFCYIIISASCKSSSVLKLESRLWKWLGNLSYGIYMWHMVVLALVLLVVKKSSIKDGWQLDVLLYGGVLVITVLIAWFSYTYIEKPFLRMKKKFMIIKSES